MRTFKYEIQSQCKGQVTAKDIPDAIHKAIDEYYKTFSNTEELECQFLSIMVDEIKT